MVSGLPLTWLPILIKLVASQDFNKPDLPQCGDLNMQSDDALAKLIGSLKEDSLECFKAGVVQSEARHLIYQAGFPEKIFEMENIVIQLTYVTATEISRK